jgi:hypothetical protein
MGRVLTLLDVGTSIKLAVSAVAVALLAFGAMASPASAEDTALAGWCASLDDPVINAEVGQEVTIPCTVVNDGPAEAEGVSILGEIRFDFEGLVEIKPGSFSVSATQGACGFLPDPDPLQPATLQGGCELGDIAFDPSIVNEAVVTIKFVPTTSGVVAAHFDLTAKNVSSVEGDMLAEVIVSAPGEEPGGDNGDRVLVDHKGKELCLPKAALNGHLKHGDEVIDEEGCSDTAQGAVAAQGMAHRR